MTTTNGLTIADWLMITSVLLAPLIAVQVQKHLERHREDRGRKLNVFKTLMATRAATVSPDHVQALNMIDLEFYGDKKITDAWKTYHDHLNRPSEENQQFGWQEKSKDLLTKLLIEMGSSLDYQFDEVHVKRAAYFPQAHANLDEENMLIRTGLIRLLYGDANLKMDIASIPISEEEALEQKALREQLQDLLQGRQQLRVVVSSPDGNGSKPSENAEVGMSESLVPIHSE